MTRAALSLGCVALMWGLGCSELLPKQHDSGSGGTGGGGTAVAGTAGASSGGDPAPYLGDWHLTGTVTTTCSDGTSDYLPLSGLVSITRGTSSDLLRTVVDGTCWAFPLNVKAANATLASSVACPAEAASQATVTSWQVTLGADDTSATETGRAKTIFAPPQTGTCTSTYATTLVK